MFTKRSSTRYSDESKGFDSLFNEFPFFKTLTVPREEYAQKSRLIRYFQKTMTGNLKNETVNV